MEIYAPPRNLCPWKSNLAKRTSLAGEVLMRIEEGGKTCVTVPKSATSRYQKGMLAILVGCVDH